MFGPELTRHDVDAAIAYNQHRIRGTFQSVIRAHIGLPADGELDEVFVRALATWQETFMGRGQGDGKVGYVTEASLNILLPEAQRAADAALAAYARGGVLFDSWGNDMRDNDGNGLVDDAGERASWDGAHYGRGYREFGVRRGHYEGGWPDARGRPTGTVDVTRDRAVSGTFHYAVCADLISEAYRAAGVMPHHGSTAEIMNELRRKGYVWQRSVSYPTVYLPGDYICTFARGHGGHSAIVVAQEPTRGGAQAPYVVELPGPSSQVTDHTYDPASTSDIAYHRWSHFRTLLPFEFQFVCRLLHTRLHH